MIRYPGVNDQFYFTIEPTSHSLPMKSLMRAERIGAALQASIAIVVLLVSAIHPAFTLAQEAPLTRQQELRQQREAKSTALKPYEAGSLEAGTLYVQKKRLLERVAEGWKGIHQTMSRPENASHRY
jgi:hypothetical protein